MSGRGKSFVWLDYLTAYEVAWHEGVVSLDTPTNRSNSGDQQDSGMIFLDTFESDIPSPENILIKKEAFLNLSEEAKEVILLIFNAPQEILDCFFTAKYHKISRDKIYQFLIQNKHWNRKVVNRCFKELKDFSSQID